MVIVIPSPLHWSKTAYKYEVANGGRLAVVDQKIDTGDWRNLATYTYDNFERLLKKNLGGVECQQYSYDIRGMLTGINREYTLVGGTANAPTTFGCLLAKDYGFSHPRLDGKLSGYYWRGAGTTPARAYGYDYDPAGRLRHAEFREYTPTTI